MSGEPDCADVIASLIFFQSSATTFGARSIAVLSLSAVPASAPLECAHHVTVARQVTQRGAVRLAGVLAVVAQHQEGDAAGDHKSDHHRDRDEQRLAVASGLDLLRKQVLPRVLRGRGLAAVLPARPRAARLLPRAGGVASRTARVGTVRLVGLIGLVRHRQVFSAAQELWYSTSQLSSSYFWMLSMASLTFAASALVGSWNAAMMAS